MRYSFVADHFSYLSIIGLIALAAAGVTRLVKEYLTAEQVTGALAGAAAVVLIACFAVSNARAGVFENVRVLWEDTLRKNPDSWFAANNYGDGLLSTGEPEKVDAAERWFRKVIQLKPDHAELRYNLGRVAEFRKDPDTAIKWYKDALKYRPNYTLPIYRIGAIFATQGELQQAAEQYQRVIEINPADVNAHLVLGKTYEDLGRFDDAIAQYEAASAA